MKIAHKIFLLIFFLFIIWGINNSIGLIQLTKMGQELERVVHEDVALTEVITSITHHQLEKTILFERLLRIAEEVGFEQVSVGRRDYLLDHVKLTQSSFTQLTQLIDQDIAKAKELIQKGQSHRAQEIKNRELSQILDLLNSITETHQRYNNSLEDIFKAIYTTNYQLSFEDISRVDKERKILDGDVKSLLDKVQKMATRSLVKAEEEETTARKILNRSFVISLVLSLLITFFLIRSIVLPLRTLEKAAEQIGVGNFNVHLANVSRNEIGSVSQAFNIMAQKLADFRRELEDKNKILAENLAITRQQKIDLEKVNAELDNFVHTVSHDIANPVMALIWYSTYLEKNCKDKLDLKSAETITSMRKGAERLKRLIDDLITLTKISRVQNPFEQVVMGHLVEEVKERLEFDLKKFNVDLRIQESLPIVNCDRIKMAEAFFNLISNAIKFSSPVLEQRSGPGKNIEKRPVIDVGGSENPTGYKFFVKDNGMGIKPEDQDQIFDMFKRTAQSENYDGRGVGLSIVKRVMDDHGGKVWVESSPGQGACFYFIIPKKTLC